MHDSGGVIPLSCAHSLPCRDHTVLSGNHLLFCSLTSTKHSDTVISPKLTSETGSVRSTLCGPLQCSGMHNTHGHAAQQPTSCRLYVHCIVNIVAVSPPFIKGLLSFKSLLRTVHCWVVHRMTGEEALLIQRRRHKNWGGGVTCS